jgi:hypothetical protein
MHPEASMAEEHAFEQNSQGSFVPAPQPLELSELDRMAHERKQLRRLQTMMNMCMQVIAQDESMQVEEASQMVAECRNAALTMFPGKEFAYDLIWKPRFQRLMLERFRLQ